MKRLTLILLLLAATAHAEDSPLVKAAKASGGPKKKSTRKVITNADVKKSSGKVKEGPATKPQAAKPEAPKSPLQQQEEQRKAANVAAKRVAAAQTKVTDLENELSRIEQRYYESGDPNDRDTNIAARFRQTRQQLDQARKELADAREAETKLKPKTSS